MPLPSPIVVFGAHGQVGSALISQLPENTIALSRDDIDLTTGGAIEPLLEKLKPAAIINAAAYTAVDKAEEEANIAERINHVAPTEMARYAKEQNIPFIHYSTDYVFDGSGEAAWKEDDATGPLGVYGKTKLAGEEAISAIGGDYLIFRTSWVYDAKGKNFLNTMLRLGAERESLNVVNDQIGAPTYAEDIAFFSLKALEKALEMQKFPKGVYHLTNRETTSWHGFASSIFEEARARGAKLAIKDVGAIPTADYPTPAARPLNSRMDIAKIQTTFDIELPSWKNALSRCMDVKYKEKAKAHGSY
jgi:dTDP-4-dehydrorhamnose reductase